MQVTAYNYWYAVLWIRNDLFQVRLRILNVPDPDATHVILANLDIIKKNHYIIDQREESTGTNDLPFSISHYRPTVQNSQRNKILSYLLLHSCRMGNK